jgi:hypothetical protein
MPSGGLASGMKRSTSAIPAPDMYSNAWIAAGSCCWQAWNSCKRRLGRGDRAERHLDLARPRKQLQHRGGDDAERPLAADKQLAQAIAGIVLVQAAQAVPHLPVGQHDLQPQHEVARIAVAHRVVAAGIGREHAADLRLPSELIDSGSRQSASSAASCAAFSVTPASISIVMSTGSMPRTRFIRDRDRMICEPSSLTAAPPTIEVLPPCGTIGTRVFGAEPHRIGDLGRVRRAQHRRRAAVVEPPPILAIGVGVGRVGQDAARPEALAQAVDQPGIILIPSRIDPHFGRHRNLSRHLTAMLRYPSPRRGVTRCMP